jgi:hypothetical protein
MGHSLQTTAKSKSITISMEQSGGQITAKLAKASDCGEDCLSVTTHPGKYCTTA